MGARMAGSAISIVRGAEISERSAELILPGNQLGDAQAPQDEPSYANPSQRENGVNEPQTPRASQPPKTGTADRGIALPGDRGPRAGRTQEQRPSFWRRIAIGRKAHAPVEPVEKDGTAAGLVPAKRAASSPPPALAQDIERRIVEPMLQALVSVEAKLERSHVEVMGRSDQVEQRLSQLWDIEEQLGALGELQESLLKVSAQQRRLESAIGSQTRAVRWLVGAVFVSLAMAAFVVAAVLR